MLGKKKGGWHTVYNDVIICLRKDLYYCFKCALILILFFFLLFNISQMLELLIINLMMCEKIVYSIAGLSHTQLSLIMKCPQCCRTWKIAFHHWERVSLFLIWLGFLKFEWECPTLKLNSWMKPHTGILTNMGLTLWLDFHFEITNVKFIYVILSIFGVHFVVITS